MLVIVLLLQVLHKRKSKILNKSRSQVGVHKPQSSQTKTNGVIEVNDYKQE